MASKAHYPADHKAAMPVPLGGSNCAKCEYWEKAKPKECGNSYYIAWNGSGKIPTSPDRYCSDWFEPKKTMRTNADIFKDAYESYKREKSVDGR